MTKSQSHTPDTLRLPPADPAQESCVALLPGRRASTALLRERANLSRSQGKDASVLHNIQRVSRPSESNAASTIRLLSP